MTALKYDLEQHPQFEDLLLVRFGRGASWRYFQAISARGRAASHPLGDIRDFAREQFGVEIQYDAQKRVNYIKKEDASALAEVFALYFPETEQAEGSPDVFDRQDPTHDLERVELWRAVEAVRREARKRMASQEEFDQVWETRQDEVVEAVRAAFSAQDALSDAFEPSPYQQRVFDSVLAKGQEGKHVFVEAVAGSGKTTTIFAAAQRVEAILEQGGLMMAFNASIASELNAGLARRGMKEWRAGTMHSLSRKWLRQAMPKLPEAVDLGKYARLSRQLVKGRYPRADKRKQREMAEIIDQAHRMLALTLVFRDPSASFRGREEQAYRVLRRYNVMGAGSGLVSTEHELVELAAELFRVGWAEVEQGKAYDFLDTEIAPTVLDLGFGRDATTQSASLPFRWNDRLVSWLFVDEAQDLNVARLEFARRLVEPKGRIVFVGDPYQSIYGFTGSDPEMVPKIIEEFHAEKLPLSVSYRCARAICVKANAILPPLHNPATGEPMDRVQPRPGAPEGVVRDEGDYTAALLSLQPGDLVLSRTNAVAVGAAKTLLKAGKRVLVSGKDLDRQLTEMARLAMKMRDANRTPYGLERMLEGVAALERVQRDALVRKLGKVRAEQPMRDLEDRGKVLETLYELAHAENMLVNQEAFFSYLRSFFANVDETSEDVRAQSVLCSTVHRAKGLEAKRVVWVQTESDLALFREADECIFDGYVGDDPCTSKMMGWEAEQIRNLRYVAVTRAKAELIIVPAPEL